ncbi:MAG: proline dehydrogenase family protein [Bacteroidia bacterium]|nr:proline dehydrogenase family protein [Bacteroidia bacterium]
MIQFDNLEIAFRYKSDRELKFAYWLFRMVGNPNLVRLGKKITYLALKLHLPVSWLVKPTIYRHFCGGETIDECMKVSRKIEKFGVNCILDYSVEGGESPTAIRAALEETLRTIENARLNRNIPFTVFKPTAFTLNHILEKGSQGTLSSVDDLTEADKFRERVEILCKAAFDADVPIMVDAEDVKFQPLIDEVVTHMMEKYNQEKALVYNTLQMYRTDRLEFLKESYRKAVEGNYYLGIKFVRGAYMERERARALKYGYPSPINPDKPTTDRMYDDGLRFTIDHLDRISVFNGTHNEESNRLLTELMEQKGLAKDEPKIWFSQLFGMSDHVSFNLSAAGYNVAKYLPYGPVRHVLPYLIRRAEENTAVAGQSSRELRMARKEYRRRKEVRA